MVCALCGGLGGGSGGVAHSEQQALGVLLLEVVVECWVPNPPKSAKLTGLRPPCRAPTHPLQAAGLPEGPRPLSCDQEGSRCGPSCGWLASPAKYPDSNNSPTEQHMSHCHPCVQSA